WSTAFARLRRPAFARAVAAKPRRRDHPRVADLRGWRCRRHRLLAADPVSTIDRPAAGRLWRPDAAGGGRLRPVQVHADRPRSHAGGGDADVVFDPVLGAVRAGGVV